ncbi:MAG: outer membrane protein assembly factor BamA [Holosporaceae bacterium]|jgi:outer membrane protein insertion porin family|nr:outer membrane protein assembly factor BamA [Holosporaceae bacterium]
MKKTLLLVLGLYVPEALADVVDSVAFEGLNLVESGALEECVAIAPGKEFGQSEIEATIKALFAKGFFLDVKIVKKGQTLIIRCVERLMVNKVAFEGNDAVKDETLNAVVNGRIVDGCMLANHLVRDVISDVQAVYASLGYYAVKITPKIIKHTNQKIDLIFEVDEGSKTTVKKILFIGNKLFSDDELKDVLTLKEERIWRFGYDGHVFAGEKIAEDVKILTEFYHDNGFPFFSVKLASAEMGHDKKSHYCTFIVNEGDQFKIQSVSLKSKVKRVKASGFKKFISLKSGEIFNQSLITKNRIDVLREIALENNPFVDVSVQVDFDKEKKTANINYIIVERPKAFIEKIEITGNVRTLDHVIRREFSVHEGDPLNIYKMEKTIQTLNGIGYFSNVNVREEKGSSEDKRVLIVSVKEKDSTSRVNFGLSAGVVDGFGGFVGFSEDNLFGKGRTVGADIFWSQRHLGGTMNLYDPYFMDQNFGAGIKVGIEKLSTRKDIDQSVLNMKYISPYVRYDITKNLSHIVRYTLSHNDKSWWNRTERRALQRPPVNASGALMVDEYGKFTSGELSSTLIYENLDNHYEPRDGYSVSMSNTYCGLVGNVRYLKNAIGFKYYYPLSKKFTFILDGNFGYLYEMKNTRTYHRFLLGGGDSGGMRGFDVGGVGPRDANENSLGSNKFWTVSSVVKVPLSSRDIGINGIVFLDVGSAWGTKYHGENINDSSAIRASAGVAIEWTKSPFGMPMSFVFGFPIKKQEFDMKRVFSINGIM